MFLTHFPKDIYLNPLKMTRPHPVEQEVSEKSHFIYRASLGNGKESSNSLVPFMYYIDYLVKLSKSLCLENLKKVLLPQSCIRREGWFSHEGFKNFMCSPLIELHHAIREREIQFWLKIISLQKFLGYNQYGRSSLCFIVLFCFVLFSVNDEVQRYFLESSIFLHLKLPVCLVF